MWHYGLEKDALRDLGVLPDRQQDMSQGGQESQRNLGLSKTVWPTGLGSDCPLYSVLGDHNLNATLNFGSLIQKGTIEVLE